MIVPRYWAEGRSKHRKSGKQMTVRRFGWSDVSQEEAQVLADRRTEEALQRILSGEKLVSYEPKIPYNGADGVPIREEILDQRGDTIITRNSYGAHCLNTPNVFFADLDFERPSPPNWPTLIGMFFFGAAMVVGNMIHALLVAFVIAFLGAIACSHLCNLIIRSRLKSPEESYQITIEKIRNFVSKHTDWNFRIYRTPAGVRTLATHQLFDPSDSDVLECFNQLGTDPIYRQMCLKQRCFRARVSPKPWRIGIGYHMRPRPGTWPVKPERISVRNEWIIQYESAARAFAACEWMESIGSGIIAEEVVPVLVWHDELSRATSNLPIA